MSEPLNTSIPQPDDEHAGGFQLDHASYGIAVFVSTVTTFGVWGIIPGLLIPAAWAFVFYSPSRPTAFAIVCAAVLVVFLLSGLVLPAVQNSRRASRILVSETT